MLFRYINNENYFSFNFTLIDYYSDIPRSYCIPILRRGMQKALYNLNAVHAEKSCNNRKTAPFPLNSHNIAADADLNMHYVSAIVTRNYSRFRQQHIYFRYLLRLAYLRSFR